MQVLNETFDVTDYIKYRNRTYRLLIVSVHRYRTEVHSRLVSNTITHVHPQFVCFVPVLRCWVNDPESGASSVTKKSFINSHLRGSKSSDTPLHAVAQQMVSDMEESKGELFYRPKYINYTLNTIRLWLSSDRKTVKKISVPTLILCEIHHIAFTHAFMVTSRFNIGG